MILADVVGPGLGVLGVVLALAVPAFVEWKRRPQLVIVSGSDANRIDPTWRIVHVAVVNQPIRGFLGRILLRNVATGCDVELRFVSRSDGTELVTRGKWSAKPEPLVIVPSGPGLFARIFSSEMVPQGLSADVSPGELGQVVAVAIKHEADDQAYAFGPDLYSSGDLRRPELALPHEEYRVTVTARAGEITSSPTEFRLLNAGPTSRDLRL